MLEGNWVSVKIDAISQNIWYKINRPHASLKLQEILEEISGFSNSFNGYLVTETMLIKDINDNSSELENIADFISNLNIKKSYLSIPTRPPAEKGVKPATEYKINSAYQIFKEKGIGVEYLIGYEGNAFAYTGNVEEDLLGITSVHPMKEEAIIEFLKKADSNWDIIKELLEEKKLVEIKYKENKFYMRKLPGEKN